LASKEGMIKRTALKDLGVSNKSIKESKIMGLEENDVVVSFDIALANAITNIYTVTKLGLGLSYPAEQISIIGKNGSGSLNVKLKDNDEVVSSFYENPNKEFIFVSCSEGAKRIYKNQISLGKRAATPKAILAQTKDNKFQLTNAYLVNGNDYLMYLTDKEESQIIKASEFAIGDNDTRVASYKSKKFKNINFFDALRKEDIVVEEKKDEVLDKPDDLKNLFD
jgi:DNA gyrase/topoisomerase IV subunit A